jgi:hypothetical protein
MDVSGVNEAHFILQNPLLLSKGRSEGKAASGKAFEYITVFSSPARPQGRAPTSLPAILFFFVGARPCGRPVTTGFRIKYSNNHNTT